MPIKSVMTFILDFVYSYRERRSVQSSCSEGEGHCAFCYKPLWKEKGVKASPLHNTDKNSYYINKVDKK